MVCADAGLHADETRRQVGEPCFYLAAGPLLAQHDRATPIVPHHVKRVLADIDTDHGDCRIELVGHGVLLVFGAPCQLPLLAGREHGRTIPLADMDRIEFPQCSGPAWRIGVCYRWGWRHGRPHVGRTPRADDWSS